MLDWSQSAGKKLALSYICGVYFGDGNIRKSSFRLNTIDEDFAKATSLAIFELIGKNSRIVKTYDKRFSNAKPNNALQVNSKLLCDLISEITLNRNKFPDFVINGSNDIKKEFIAGVMDSEGWICWSKWVTRRNGNTWKGNRMIMGIKVCSVWLDEFVKLLNSVGVITGKRRVEKPKYEHYKIPIVYRINIKSWIESGCYFKIQRKQNRVIEYKNRFILNDYTPDTLSDDIV